MFTFSQTLYLLNANLNLVANTSILDVAQYHLQHTLTANCLHCWSTGLNEKAILMKYFISMEMYANKCTEKQVCNDCTYKQNRVFEVLSEDIRLSIYFRFKVLNTL